MRVRTGHSFDDCIIRGINPRDLRTPCHLGRGNVLWPSDWTEAMRSEWRRLERLPGEEWSPPGAAWPLRPIRRFLKLAGSVGGQALAFAL